MKLHNYILELEKLHAQYPNAKLVYASDDEGNSYSEVNWPPSPINFDFNNMVPTEKKKINAILIN